MHGVDLWALSSSGFMPHGHCYLWTPSLLWTYVLSDGVIALAYYSIPIALMVFVRQRRDLQFSWVFVLFSVFIFACGTTHLLSIWTIWNPDYYLDATVKALTALASIVTAVLLWPLLPKALALPSPSQLQLALDERQRVITERERAQAELAAVNATLERRVAERTAALQLAEQKLQEMLSAERGARAEAERVGRMKDEFLLTLSHELRTPLSAIFGWAQMLKRKADGKTIERAVDVIDRNVRIQTKLIEDLLDMSAIVAGKIRLDVQTVDMSGVINLAVESIRPAAEAKGIRIEKVIDPLAGPVSGDAERLQQVIWNLLNNAAKFTPKDGKISVVLERVNSHIEISVVDTGEGIAPDFLPMIFDRFSQADASSRRVHGGVGLGLSIAKSLVESHGGTVRARSRGLGQGSTFTVHRPFRALEKPEGQHEHPRTSISGADVLADDEWPNLAGTFVLVVDDEKDARDLVRAILEDRGATVTTAASAVEAREQIAKSAPGVIVCDIGMPSEDGYDFIVALRRDGVAIPAVALTAFARPEDRVRSIKAGFAGHLAKPVEPAELLVMVASMAGHYHPG
ncbi:MAG TPA: ATP-binding protein [Steroidobacteraceae bacterium]|nr:ATP-binding protein [Steroidobacteraceae bacterium]